MGNGVVAVRGHRASAPATAVAPGPLLLERERELSRLSEALAHAVGGSGSLILVEGPAGIGKSGLLGAAGEEAGRESMHVLRARGLELERDVPFGVARQLFEGCLAAASDTHRDELLAGHAGLARSLFNSAAQGASDPQSLTRGLYWLVVNLSRRAPLAIALDDAQWSDRSSLAFLAHLASRFDGLPVAVLAAVRTGEPATADDVLDSLRHLPGCTRLVPEPLSEAGVGRLVAEELPDAEPPFVAACARVTAGNPFMTRELVRALNADGVAPTAASVARVDGLVPATVLHSVLARLGRLGEPAHRMASAVAVLGDGAPLRYAISLAGLNAPDAESAADALARAKILADGEPLRFVHPLIATAVHSDLPAFARARLHRAAAQLLAADHATVQGVAAHLLLSTPTADLWTQVTLRDAARRDLEQGDPAAAVRLLTRALDEPPPSDQRAAVLIELAEAKAMSGDTDAERHVSEALELLEEPRDRVLALRVRSHIKGALGDHDAAAQALREILDTVGPSDPDAQQILAAYLTVNRFRTRLHPEAASRLAPIVEAARRGSPPGDPGLLAHVTLDLALAGAHAETVRSLAERATANDPLVDLAGHGMLMGILVQALCCVDELELAERIADAGLRAARERGSFIAAGVASYHRAIPRYHRGALADALADLDEALAPSREGWIGGEAWSEALQAHVQIERGELEAAADPLLRSSPKTDAMDAAITLFARARVALATRDPETALADAEAAGRHLADGFGIDHPGLVPWRRTAVLAALALEDHSHARRLATEQLELARSTGIKRAIGLALRTTAATVAGAQQIALLTEAVSVLEGSPSQLERAHAFLDLGSALRRASRRSDARAPLREALQLADGFGAAPLAQAARVELRATGVRPRRAAFSGADALTPAERRVAGLAAQGMTNAEIAQQLFVTAKTVQTHLAHSYRKLEISSRRQLPVALGGAQPNPAQTSAPLTRR
jgi:DNA-binding CsgD family transcriptional regulator